MILISILYEEGQLKRLRCDSIKGKIKKFKKKRPRKLWILEMHCHIIFNINFFMLLPNSLPDTI